MTTQRRLVPTRGAGIVSFVSAQRALSVNDKCAGGFLIGVLLSATVHGKRGQDLSVHPSGVYQTSSGVAMPKNIKKLHPLL